MARTSISIENTKIDLTKVKRTWFPDVHQVVMGTSEGNTYLHSLWVGLTAPILNMPYMLWSLILKPVFYGVFTMVAYCTHCFVSGVTGKARGLALPRFGAE